MKIGFLIDKISYGGGERILNFLMQEMALEGHSIYIFSWNKEWEQKEISLGYKLITIPHIKIGIFKKINGIFSFKKKLRIVKPDCLIIFSLSLSEFGVLSAKLSGIPVILSERVDPKNRPQKKIHYFIKKMLFLISDGVVFQTEQAKSHYSRFVKKKGTVIPNPVICDNIPVSSISKCKKEIVAVGRLSSEKNFQMLIKAFSKLQDNGYILKIYGDGPLKQELTALIEELNLVEKVFLMGHSERVTEEIYNSDIFVMCSNHEGMPNALIEAMAVGLACISTDFNSGGARTLINDGKNGLLIPVNNENELINALILLIQNEKFKSSIKREALLIKVKYHKKIIINSWISFLLSKI